MREEGWPHSQLFPFMNMIHIGVSYFLTGFPQERHFGSNIRGATTNDKNRNFQKNWVPIK